MLKIDEANERKALELIREAADNLNAAYIQLDNDRPTRAFAEVDAASNVLRALNALRLDITPPKPDGSRLRAFKLTEKQIAHLSYFLGELTGQLRNQRGPLDGTDRVFLEMHNDIVSQINAQIGETAPDTKQSKPQ